MFHEYACCWCDKAMKIDDEFHQKAILVCIDELASRPSTVDVSLLSVITLVVLLEQLFFCVCLYGWIGQ